MSLGIAAVVVFVLYLIDKNHQWKAAGKVVVAVVILAAITASLVAFGQSKPQPPLAPYVIIAHTEYNYTVRHGRNVIKVSYHDSQTNTAKPGDAPGTGLHYHSRNGAYPHGPDLSQVPEVGLRINQCVLSEKPDHYGDPVIAIQPTPEPCMTQNGTTLHYLLAPNAVTFTYVNFDIISEQMEK